jgi:pSer/pThr/pTyr-binding forkhead associated (FHA) protein
VSHGPLAGRALTIGERPILVGADDQTDVRIDEVNVSPFHAHITLHPEGLLVQDLRSRTGTWFGRQRVRRKLLAPGEEIRIGDTMLRFEAGEAARPPEKTDPVPPTESAEQARLPVPETDRGVALDCEDDGNDTVPPSSLGQMTEATGYPPRGGPDHPSTVEDHPEAASTQLTPSVRNPYRLLFLSGPRKGESVSLAPGAVALGRDPGCDISFMDPRLSRRHMELIVESDSLRFRDLECLHGVRVNGQPLEAGELHVGDRVQVGATNIAVERELS